MLRREATDGAAQATPHLLLVAADGPQHVARLKGRRSTGGGGGHGEVWHRGQHRFCVLACEAEVEGTRQARRAVAVDGHAHLLCREAVQQTLPQGQDTLSVLCHAGPGPPSRGAQAHDCGHVQGPGAETLLVASTEDLRLTPDVLARIAEDRYGSGADR